MKPISFDDFNKRSDESKYELYQQGRKRNIESAEQNVDTVLLNIGISDVGAQIRSNPILDVNLAWDKIVLDILETASAAEAKFKPS